MNWLKLHFVIAVWLTIVYGIFAAMLNLWSASEVFMTWGPFAMRVLLAPVGLAAMQLMWWFTVYKPHGLEARPVMIMMGIAFLCLLLVMWLRQEMHGMRPGALRYLGVVYVAGGHLAYGIFGRDHADRHL